MYVDNYRGVHDRALRNGKKCQNNKKLKSNNKITRRRRNLDLFFSAPLKRVSDFKNKEKKRLSSSQIFSLFFFSLLLPPIVCDTIRESADTAVYYGLQGVWPTVLRDKASQRIK